jgi:hypothetical protein
VCHQPLVALDLVVERTEHFGDGALLGERWKLKCELSDVRPADVRNRASGGHQLYVPFESWGADDRCEISLVEHSRMTPQPTNALHE